MAAKTNIQEKRKSNGRKGRDCQLTPAQNSNISTTFEWELWKHMNFPNCLTTFFNAIWSSQKSALHEFPNFEAIIVWVFAADNWWQSKQTLKKNGEARAGRKRMPVNSCKRNNMSTNMSTTFGWELWKMGFPNWHFLTTFYINRRQFEARKRVLSTSCWNHRCPLKQLKLESQAAAAIDPCSVQNLGFFPCIKKGNSSYSMYRLFFRFRKMLCILCLVFSDSGRCFLMPKLSILYSKYAARIFYICIYIYIYVLISLYIYIHMCVLADISNLEKYACFQIMVYIGASPSDHSLFLSWLRLHKREGPRTADLLLKYSRHVRQAMLDSMYAWTRQRAKYAVKQSTKKNQDFDFCHTLLVSARPRCL